MPAQRTGKRRSREPAVYLSRHAYLKNVTVGDERVSDTDHCERTPTQEKRAAW